MKEILSDENVLTAAAVASPFAASEILNIVRQEAEGLKVRGAGVSTDQTVNLPADSTVPVSPGAEVPVTVSGTNTGDSLNSMAVGVSFRDPNGQVRDTAPVSTGQVPAGGGFSQEVSVNQDVNGDLVFDQQGSYDLLVTIYDTTDAQNQLSDFYIIEDAVEVQIVPDAEVGTVTLDGITVKQ